MVPLNFYKSTSVGLCKKTVLDLSIVDLIVFARRLCSVFGLHLPLKCVVTGNVTGELSEKSLQECIDYLHTIKCALPKSNEELADLFYEKFCGSVNLKYYQETLDEWKRVFTLITNLLEDGYHVVEIPVESIVSVRSDEIMTYLICCWDPGFDSCISLDSVYFRTE